MFLDVERTRNFDKRLIVALFIANELAFDKNAPLARRLNSIMQFGVVDGTCNIQHDVDYIECYVLPEVEIKTLEELVQQHRFMSSVYESIDLNTYREAYYAAKLVGLIMGRGGRIESRLNTLFELLNNPTSYFGDPDVASFINNVAAVFNRQCYERASNECPDDTTYCVWDCVSENVWRTISDYARKFAVIYIASPPY